VDTNDCPCAPNNQDTLFSFHYWHVWYGMVWYHTNTIPYHTILWYPPLSPLYVLARAPHKRNLLLV
jgi:hypothetical protein